MDFVEILFQYEKAGLQNEAIEIILEISDVSHWPGTDFHYRCWLKTMRETAIDEAEKGQPFTLPPSDIGFGLQNDYPSICDDIPRENE